VKAFSGECVSCNEQLHAIPVERLGSTPADINTPAVFLTPTNRRTDRDAKRSPLQRCGERSHHYSSGEQVETQILVTELPML